MKAVRAIPPNDVAKYALRGQYVGYPADVDSPDTTTETFARLELRIDNDRWRGVKMTLQSGKRLDAKTTQVVVEFTRPGLPGNTLTFHLHPYEGVSIGLTAKKPGFGMEREQVTVSLEYPDFRDGSHPKAYERVMMDGIRGDQTLFATSDEVLESWRVVDSVVSAWQKSADGLVRYAPGSTPTQVIDAG